MADSYERLDDSLPDSRSYSTFDWKSAIPSRTRSKSRISIESMDESESSLIMISSRPPSVRSRSIVDPVVLASEPDTFCVLPSRMRVLCLLLTLLLIASLIAAITNSLQNAHAGSKGFCKPVNVTRHTPDLLCPNETMFIYYECCGLPQELKCCGSKKLWLMASLVCVSLAVLVSLGFAFSKYVIGY